MGKPAQCEGSTIGDSYQQQQCGPRSALEIWRSPTASNPTLVVQQAHCQSDDGFSFSAVHTPAENLIEKDWSIVGGLESAQLQALQNVASRGVFWTRPAQDVSAVFTLHHGGEVEADGNCLFTATKQSMQLQQSPLEVRLLTVKRFLQDFDSGHYSRQAVNDIIRHLYSPDLTTGWGVQVVQEVKILAKKTDREALDSAISELVALGVSREAAAESIYKERGIPVDNADSWSKYMSLAGALSEEYDIINLQYTEEGLFNVDEHRDGGAAAFGDDIAIECLANEFEREIFVMQAHGTDAMVEGEHCLFFLPHRPRSQSGNRYPPAFLFMKGTGWCGAGADHYEPVIARVSPNQLPKSAAIVL
ncbi:unnamed protein product [Calypogeia fissa]